MWSKIQFTPIVKTIPLGNAAPLGKQALSPRPLNLRSAPRRPFQLESGWEVEKWAAIVGCDVLLILSLSGWCPLPLVLLALTADVSTFYLGLGGSPSPRLSLFYSPCDSLVQSPNSASTLAVPCRLALSSAVTSPWDRGGVLWEHLVST